MNKILEYLQQPFPMIQKPWQAVTIPSFIVILATSIPALFQPHGIKPDEIGSTIFKIAGFTLITLIPIFIALYILPHIFKKIYTPETWTIGRYVLACLCLLCITTLGNFIFYNNITRHPPGVFYRSFAFWMIFTFLVGLIPICIITFITQNSELTYNLKYAKELNRYLEEQNSIDRIVDTEEKHNCCRNIILSGDTKDTIELIPENILYIEASGNYVLIWHKENHLIHQVQLRTTLSKIESDLQQYPIITRCHRAFLVNSMHVVNIEGNSQGLQLHFHDMKENIPVSRTYLKTIRNKLNTKRLNESQSI